MTDSDDVSRLSAVIDHQRRELDRIRAVVCGRYSPDTRVLRWARAGHLPPVLVRAGSAWDLPLPGGILLGMDPDASYEEATESLQPGDTVLLFTDGLIERRGESIEEVLGEFVSTLARGTPESPGPLNYAGVNPKVSCHMPSPSS